MLQDIFAPDGKTDPYLRAADQRAGAYSILTGIAANISMASGVQVNVADLVQEVGYPDYTPMPTADEPLKA